MIDVFSPSERSRIMRRVKSKDTAPEMLVRRLVYSLGYRYRLHRKDLPGKPDLAFIAKKKAIFVHGCFWHAHGCKRSKLPETRKEYWAAKIDRNQKRDEKNRELLTKLGWMVLSLWECELKDRNQLEKNIKQFLEESI